ncbi:serine hydrolase domain-containing protein [Govanella unica]|uniref:Beta-lactamase family protein n=1 Tax=Govanella unica TaxID=2975056 RepID=A0A9X3TZU6_9PROT|nr:serine hydrolase domain-containing protein [Govania unica]MDA5195006.1 beta-lactamase family protein [Govania unica]
MTIARSLWGISLAAMVVAGSAAAQTPEPVPAPATSAAPATPPRGEVVFTPDAKRAYDYRNGDQRRAISSSRQVRHGSALWALPAGTPVDVSYDYKGVTSDIEGFMARNTAVGMIAIKGGRVVLERYRLGNRAETQWSVQSDSKSVTSTLVGAAIRDGAIHSVTDLVTRYIPELAGSAYDGVTVRDLLQMSSGIDLHDDYVNPESDYAKLQKAYTDSDPKAVVKFLATLRRAAPPGTKFSYSGSDTYLLGLIVRRTTGKSLAAYLSEKIWAPAGMEFDATWALDAGGQELAAGGLRVTLRDMARFGLIALAEGKVKGKKIVPDDWFANATRVAAGDRLAPGVLQGYEPMGYGYQWWTMPCGGGSNPIGGNGAFAAMGVFGQQVFIMPKEDMVVVIQSAWEKPMELDRVNDSCALVSTLIQKLRH